MPDHCLLEHQGLWNRLAAIVPLLHLPSPFGWQVMGPMAGLDGGARWQGPMLGPDGGACALGSLPKAAGRSE